MGRIGNPLSKINGVEKNLEHYQGLLRQLQSATARVMQGGGEQAIERHHARGKLTARERIAKLLDPGTRFQEIGLFAAHEMYQEVGGAPSAGTVLGIGVIHGRNVVIVANDATVKAGAWFPITCKKNLRAQEIAMENRLPIVYLVDSAGVFLPYQSEIFPDRGHHGTLCGRGSVPADHER
jgi:acetyl-CoA carboxylase carboxyltransferase component